MEDLSVLVWNELCRFVGTEEKIYIKRRKYALVETVKNLSQDTYLRGISSGSQAEGLSLPGSDVDCMAVFENLSVSCSTDVSASDSDIVMDTNDIKPGFVRLYCHDRLKNHIMISQALSETNKGLVLSSLLFRDMVVVGFRTLFPDSEGHGPCSTFVLPGKMETDILYCFAYKAWPNVASEWIDRNRHNNWPSRDLKAEIVHDGCLIVPIGNPNSQESHMQWRLSFSIPEKKLVHSFNHTQFLCYALLKLYLKHVINANADVKDLMCSYFLKTSLFYSIEEEHVVWNKNNFLDCFWVCFRRLIKWVRNEYCPNYFIKDNNMFEGKICGDKGRILLRYLSELYHEGEYSLWRIPCLSGFATNSSIQIGSELSNAEKESMCDAEIFDAYGHDNCNPLISLRGIAALMEATTNNVDKALLVILHNQIVWNLVQTLYHQIATTQSNKIRYKHIKELKSFIVQNCMGMGKFTGMLLLAILCYLRREYTEVAIIGNDILKMWGTSCVVYRGLCAIRVYDERDYIYGKSLTLNEKVAHVTFAFLFTCILESKFYPSEIKGELVQHSALGQTLIHPVIYSYVLLFLSYYHTNSRQNMSNTLCELCIAVNDNKLCEESDRPLSNSLLQRCIQLWESWQENHRDG